MKYIRPNGPKSKADYTDRNKWWDHQRAYARAQLDYPDGLGLKRTMKRKQMLIGWLPLWTVPPQELNKLLNELRYDYHKLKKREESGETILPDTDQ